MICSLSITISKDIINEIYSRFINKSVEYSGTIKFTKLTNKKYESDKIENVKKGDNMNVANTTSVINYHTHPRICYQGQDTLFGWLSGEDIYSILYQRRRGNMGHMVLCLEGVYYMSVNEDFYHKIIEHSKSEKLLQIIGDFFKSTHNYRNKDDIKKMKKKILPYSFVDMLNNITLGNILDETKIKAKKSSNESYYILNIDDLYEYADKPKINFKVSTELKNMKMFDCVFLESNNFKNIEEFIEERKASIKNKNNKNYKPHGITVSDNLNIKIEYITPSEKTCSFEYLEKNVKKYN